jgi:GntR family transcriptional regulator
MYEVSKATVRIAISGLVRNGYLLRQQGRGTFVCKRVIPEGLAMLTSFKELMLEAGVVFQTKVLAHLVIMPTDDLDLMLDVAEDTHIIYLKRLRFVDNEPILLQESYLPYHVCPQLLDEDLESNSLLEVLETKYQVKITKVQDYIGVSEVSEAEGGLLGLPAHTPALLLEQKFFAGSHQIMYTRTLKRPERFRFFIERERKS